MTLKVKIYNGIKYNANSEKVCEHVYENVESFKVEIKSDEEVYNDGYAEFDDYNEYLTLNFTDGTKATFRNSYVDLFGPVACGNIRP